jgi:hypothetical protein
MAKPRFTPEAKTPSDTEETPGHLQAALLVVDGKDKKAPGNTQEGSKYLKSWEISKKPG